MHLRSLPGNSVTAVNPQTWRDLLSGRRESSDSTHDLRGGKSKGASRYKKRSESLRSIMQTSFDDPSITLSPNQTGPARWGEQQFSSADALTDSVIAEALTEAAVLNFRMEFQAVDQVMRDSDKTSDAVTVALLGDEGGGILTVDIAKLSTHLAADAPRIRAPSICRLRDVIVSWQKSLLPADIAQLSLSDLLESDDLALVAFEYDVVKCYVQAVFDKLGRAASLPVRCGFT